MNNLSRTSTTSAWRAALMLGAAAGTLAVFAATPAAAQSSQPAADSQALETVVVTGTLIRGVEAPTGSNILTVTTEDIQAVGVSSAPELLNLTVPQINSFNQLQTGSGAAALANPPLSLRGYGNSTGNASGATPTLVLLNGHRIVPVGFLSTNVDPSLLPPDVIKSVAVMPDGGSATYGSDAIGGVVNFITRTDVDGLELHVQNGIAENYNVFNIDITGGMSWKGGNAVLSFSHSSHDDILGKDRDYVKSDFTAHGGQDKRVLTCGYGNVTAGGVGYAAPGLAANTSNICDQTDNASIYPNEDRNSLYGFVQQQLTESVLFSMDLFWAKRKTKVLGTAPSSSGMTITNANPYFTSVAGETAHTVSYSYAHAFGDSYVTPQEFSQYQVTPKLTWDVNGNWQVRAEFNYGRSFATVHDRSVINTTAEAAALAGTTTATALNPYDTSHTDPLVLAGIRNWELYTSGINTLTSGQIVADGALFKLPGGEVRAAVGGEINRQTLVDGIATGPIGTNNGYRQYSVGRTIKAGFAELSVPIVGDDNAIPAVRRLLFSAAVRYDDYSDFGGTTNPRIGLSYYPIDDLLIRGNFQTTFTAPSLADDGNMVDTRVQVLGYSPLQRPIDYLNPMNLLRYTLVIAGAGNSLKPQTGTTFSVGADWTPKMIDGLKLGGTYWSTKESNIVSLSQFYNPDFFINPAWQSYYTLSPTLPQLQSMLGGLPLDGIASLQALYSNPFKVPYVVIDARRGNFGNEKISGIDFDASYSRDAGFGIVFGQVSGTYILDKRISNYASGPYTDYLTNGTTSRLTVVGSLGTVVGPYSARVSVNHNTGFNLPAGTVVGQTKIDSFTVVNLYLGVDLGQFGALKENELSLNVNNVFDQDPPYYNSGSGYTNGGTLGRLLTLSLRTKL
jgi:iron complex outermembrane recepter protein